MSLLISKSICIDCIWQDSCQKLHKLREMCNTRIVNTDRPVDVFDVIIITCSLKNFNRSYRSNNDMEGMYYCIDCKAMHHERSRIGKSHKKAKNYDGYND